MSNKQYKYEDSGRSMVEIIGVLAVMSLITAGAMVLVRSGATSQKRARTFDEVMAIVENIRGLYPDGFADLPTDEAEGTKLIDGLYLNTTTPFGPDTKYSIKGVGEKDYFELFIRGLDDDDCMVLATQTWPEVWGASCNSDGAVYLRFGM